MKKPTLKKILTPEAITEMLRLSGSKAELDKTIENGIAHVDVDTTIMRTFASALDAFTQADSGSKSIVWEMWKKTPWEPPAPLEAVILSYNGDLETRKSKAIVADADKAGFRPATFPEMMALGIQYPEFSKTPDLFFFGLGAYDPVGRPMMPGLFLSDDTRVLGMDYGVYGWDAKCRFVFVRK